MNLSQPPILPLLSVVVPCYNEEEVVAETVRRLLAFADSAETLRVELIFVDDGSHDRTRSLLRAFAAQDARIRLVGLARNFGHQVAITAGIDAAHGDAVVLIDGDLQDPPEIIHEMVNLWRQGYDVVYGMRTERAGESAFKLLCAKTFYRFLSLMSDVPIPLDTGDFRLLSRPVVNALRNMPEGNRFLRGMVSWVGFRQIALPYKRAPRFAGEPKYSLRKSVKLACDGLLSFSTRPLKQSLALGTCATGIALLTSLYALVRWVSQRGAVENWTLLAIAVLFMGGVQLLCVGILGEYVGRIYSEVRNRPLYVVQEALGGPLEECATLPAMALPQSGAAGATRTRPQHPAKAAGVEWLP